MSFAVGLYAAIALLSAFALGLGAKRGDMLEAALILLWCALWPVAIMFAVGICVGSLRPRNTGGRPAMTDTLLQLAARCEAATGPDLSLDNDIRLAVGAEHYAQHTLLPATLCYTASIDAALTLVPEGWAVSLMRTCTDKLGLANLYLFAKNTGGEPSARAMGKGETPALALCAVALRARAAQGGEQ